MSDLRNSIHWNKEFEQGLPDSRLGLRRNSTSVVFGRMLMERVFCANCGTDGGLITADWSPHVFYLCDLCAEKHGALNAQEIPEALVRG